MKPTSFLPISTSTFNEPVAVSEGLPSSYTQLRQRIHHDLRVQHPEWVQPNGDCPTCGSYEQRLAELIGLFQSGERKLVGA